MTITAIITTMTDQPVSGTVLLRLLSWLSPAFPLGGFAYSGGLERAAHDGLIRSGEDLESWLSSGLRHGFLWNDAVLLCKSHRLQAENQSLDDIATLAEALAGSKERYLETTSLGEAFLAASAAWPASVALNVPASPALPVAFGAVSSAHHIGLSAACQAYLHAQIAQYISAAIRLSVCGQVTGVAVLAALEGPVIEQAGKAVASSLDELGGCTFRADAASLKHETQHSRLFRS